MDPTPNIITFNVTAVNQAPVSVVPEAQTAWQTLVVADSTMSSSPTASSLAYVQSKWVADFVVKPVVVDASDKEELLIALPA